MPAWFAPAPRSFVYLTSVMDTMDSTTIIIEDKKQVESQDEKLSTSKLLEGRALAAVFAYVSLMRVWHSKN